MGYGLEGRVNIIERIFFPILLAVYLLVASAYAFNTPLWQNPDEPAHFNYIRSIAEGKGLPILQVGDYDFDYLEKLKAARFPDSMPVDALRYESHQPPLFYLLVAPLYKGVQGWGLSQQVIILRLFSVLLGGLLLIITYLTVRLLFPGDSLIALSVPAFLATVPQHIAVSAAISNDLLAEVVLSLILLVLVKTGRASLSVGLFPNRVWIVLGFLLGLALITKTSIYAGVFLVFGTLLVMGERSSLRSYVWSVLRRLFSVYGLAFLVSGWWFARNVLVYGDMDFLGLKRHDLVVAGQPRVGIFDWLTAKNFLVLSFKSFWAQFGWMGAPADNRTYVLLTILSALAGIGIVLFVIRHGMNGFQLFAPHQKFSFALFTFTILLVLGEAVWYNLQFIQPQGRYLYPAILPIGLIFVLGLREVLSDQYVPLFFLMLFVSMIWLDIYSLTGVILPALR